jgi:membrane-bound lytic murein transglycosylase F
VGEETGLDWRLLAALSYHESRYDPSMRSWAGAMGLMQIMPITAEIMNVSDPYDPRQNIMAGGRYFKLLYDRIEGAATPQDHVAFTLAAYNAGMTHLNNARRYAEEQGYDSGLWMEVKQVLPLFETPEVYEREDLRFFRGRMVRKYVADVMNRWVVFRNSVPEFVPLEEGDTVAERELELERQWLYGSDDDV